MFKTVQQIIIKHYNSVVRVVGNDAHSQSERVYGRYIRAVKGKLQGFITDEIVKLAWADLGGDPRRLKINKHKAMLSSRNDFVTKVAKQDVGYCISEHVAAHYGLSVDKHIFVDGEFVLGIECKAYAENAMIKRVLVDFHLLKTLYPKISCHLFQLESQLGGDYSKLPETVYGSQSTHSIMSYFSDVDLHITTFLKGERNIENPIHKTFKPLKKDVLEKAVALIASDLKPHFKK